MNELIYAPVKDRDRFFHEVADQLLQAAEKAIRQGYDLSLTLENPRTYHKDGRDYLKVCGEYLVKNHNTGSSSNVGVEIDENGSFLVGYISGSGSVYEHAPRIDLNLRNIDFVLNDISPSVGMLIFLVQSSSDRSSWICRQASNEISFDDAFLHAVGIYAQQPDPLLVTNFRGFHATPLYEEGVAEEPKANPAQPNLQTKILG